MSDRCLSDLLWMEEHPFAYIVGATTLCEKMDCLIVTSIIKPKKKCYTVWTQRMGHFLTKVWSQTAGHGPATEGQVHNGGASPGVHLCQHIRALPQVERIGVRSHTSKTPSTVRISESWAPRLCSLQGSSTQTRRYEACRSYSTLEATTISVTIEKVETNVVLAEEISSVIPPLPSF
jgi:hypothetical protein